MTQQDYISKIFEVKSYENVEVDFADFLKNWLESNKTTNTTGQQRIQWLGGGETTFGIDEVRSLQTQLAYSRSTNEEWWYLILKGDELSVPAQNALLKMLEEPPTQTHLCIVTTKPQLLLPTILSRCVRIKLGADKNLTTEEENKNLELFKKIETASFTELVDIAGQFKEKNDAYQFFENLQKYFYEQLRKKPDTHYLIKNLEVLHESLVLLQTNVNIRILIEQTLFKIKQNIS